MLRSVFLLGLVSFPLSYGCHFAYSLINPSKIINKSKHTPNKSTIDKRDEKTVPYKL